MITYWSNVYKCMRKAVCMEQIHPGDRAYIKAELPQHWEDVKKLWSVQFERDAYYWHITRGRFDGTD